MVDSANAVTEGEAAPDEIETRARAFGETFWGVPWDRLGVPLQERTEAAMYRALAEAVPGGEVAEERHV